MKNKKTLVSFLTLALIMIIYIVNQYLFLNLLIDPSQSKYAWIDKAFSGYLLADNVDYRQIAQDFDNKSDSCSLFIDANTSTAVYTDECSDSKSEKPIYVSESQPLIDKSNIRFSSVYEYLYGVSVIKPMRSVSSNDFPRYNEIFTSSDIDIGSILPKDVKYAQENTLYSTYSEDYKEMVLNVQVKILSITCILMLMLFTSGYIHLKKRENNVYKILGLDNKSLVKKMSKETFVMITSAYVVALSIFSLIVWLNGKLYYMSMYFEYIDKTINVLLYLVLLIGVNIIMYMYYLLLRRRDD